MRISLLIKAITLDQSNPKQHPRSRKSFFIKNYWKSLFHVQNGRSGHCPAGQFWLKTDTCGTGTEDMSVLERYSPKRASTKENSKTGTNSSWRPFLVRCLWWKVYLLNKKLWFCRLQIISLWTLSSIALKEVNWHYQQNESRVCPCLFLLLLVESLQDRHLSKRADSYVERVPKVPL